MNKAEESSTRQENMTLGARGDSPLDENKNSNNEQSVDFPVPSVQRDALENELLDHVANSKAIFKSQQKGDPELTFEEKRAIARKLLEKSRCLFLSKFGHHMKVEHLEYFSKSQDYETVYHVNRLQRYFNNSTRHIDVRNRRYEALKTLIEKGEYFGECEMMKRNPLLYEHLVGQYLTEEEKKARDSFDTSANYVDILMETIERNKLEDRLKSQQKEEDEVQEENDSDDDDDDDDDDVADDDDNRRNNISETDCEKPNYCQWGENLDEVKNKVKDRDKKLQSSKISNQEIKLLRQEFVTNMYQSFLDGKDRDFDYSTVDDNEAYDNVELRNQDEEEKYFDSEAPETVFPCNECNDQNESEDELDIYMRSLKEQTPTNPHSLDNQT